MIIPELTAPADALLIVPPYAMTNYQSLAVHVLQSVAERAGFSVKIFYANIHYAAFLGELYPRICDSGPYLLGERSFARAAWGLEEERLYHRKIYDHKGTFGCSRNPQILYPAPPPLTVEELREIDRRAGRWIASLRESFKALRAPLVGFTCSYEQINPSFALMRALKEEAPDKTTFLGGYAAEGIMAQGLASLDPRREILDFIFSGEGEESFVRFLREHREEGRLPPGRIVQGAPLQDMDSLPLGDYSSYFTQLAAYLPEQARDGSAQIALESSRGCWWGEKSHCLFCGYADDRLRFRQKSPSRFLEELKGMEGYGSRYAHMADLIMPRSHFEGVLPALAEEGAPWTLYYEQRAAWDREKLELMRRAGVLDNQPGIESLSSALLKLMGKGSSLARNLRFLREATAADIRLYWNVVWGFPGESAAEYREMAALIPLISHLIPPVGIFKLVLARFSPLHREPEKWGLREIRPLPAYYEVFPDWADRENLAYYFDCRYEAETLEDPEAMDRLVEGVDRWNEAWGDQILRPRLLAASSGEGTPVLLDTRNLGQPVRTPLEPEEAAVFLENRPYEGSPLQEWALERQAALVRQGTFVPLVTMEYALRKELENGKELERQVPVG